MGLDFQEEEMQFIGKTLVFRGGDGYMIRGVTIEHHVVGALA